jgi:hypothetical protein
MTNHTIPGSDSEKVSQDVDNGQQSTGEGAASAMAVLRDRQDIDHLIVQTESDTDRAESH